MGKGNICGFHVQDASKLSFVDTSALTSLLTLTDS